MENLFDYATKELSQDGFLCWLIDNYDDPTIGHYSYNFIRFLTGFDIKDGDIVELELKRQEKNMDIVVDFWTSKKKDSSSHYVFVIEDKTHSSLHDNQLLKYGETISKWNDKDTQEKRTAKVFYKTDEFSNKDNEELKKAKEYNWKSFNIKDIHGHFSEIRNSGSQVLDFYCDNIRKIYKKINESPEGSPAEWDILEARTFFRKIKEQLVNEQLVDIDHIYETFYQGRYYSIAFEYELNNVPKPARVCPQIEFIFRESDSKVIVYTHFAFLNNKNDWPWKLSACEEDKKPLYEQIMRTVVDVFHENGVNTRNYFARTNQTLTVDNLPKDKNLEKNAIETIKKYISLFQESGNKLKNI